VHGYRPEQRDFRLVKLSVLILCGRGAYSSGTYDLQRSQALLTRLRPCILTNFSVGSSAGRFGLPTRAPVQDQAKPIKKLA
jgi:hypothetical protein